MDFHLYLSNRAESKKVIRNRCHSFDLGNFWWNICTIQGLTLFNYFSHCIKFNCDWICFWINLYSVLIFFWKQLYFMYSFIWNFRLENLWQVFILCFFILVNIADQINIFVKWCKLLRQNYEFLSHISIVPRIFYFIIFCQASLKDYHWRGGLCNLIWMFELIKIRIDQYTVNWVENIHIIHLSILTQHNIKYNL